MKSINLFIQPVRNSLCSQGPYNLMEKPESHGNFIKYDLEMTAFWSLWLNTPMQKV